MRTVSLFSGCGGSDLGAKQAGADVVFAMDISKNAVDTYLAHKQLLASPDTAITLGDVRTLTTLPECDLLLGCYPCQSFSMGGRRAPGTDDRAIFVSGVCKMPVHNQCAIRNRGKCCGARLVK